MVWVLSSYDLAEAFPIILPLLSHEIVFVRKRPPNISESSQAAHDVVQISIVLDRRQPIKAPMTFIVGMEQDDVGFDAQIAEVSDATLQMLEKLWIEPCGVPRPWRNALKWISGRLVGVPFVMFRKDAEADFVEWRRRQRFQCLL